MTDSEANLDNSITKLKLIKALRAGKDEVSKVITENPTVTSDRMLLHLSVQISSLSTIEWLIKNYNLDVNSVDNDGNTPLHSAAKLGRTDVALYLLSLPQINDTLLNKDNKQAVEEARTPELAESMQIARARYVERIAAELRSQLDKENTEALEELLSNPRASALLDINGQDPDTGSTVLHDFVKKKNYKMVEFILNHGGDPFTRDSKGVLPHEIAKDDNIKKLLKAKSKEQSVIAPSLSQESPSISGYLKKWTNFTGGYKLRWFVLKDGELKYYKKQDDTDKGCRGAINMRNATLHLDSSEKLRFEIIAKGTNKFHLKANHPIETNRWVWALTNAIQYAKDQEKEQKDRKDKKEQQGKVSRENSVISKSTGKNDALHPPAATQFSKDDSSAVFVVDKHSLLENDLDRRGDEEIFDDEDDESLEEEAPYENHLHAVEDSIRLEVKAVNNVLSSLEENRIAGTLGEESLKDGLSTIGGVIDNMVNSIQSLVEKTDAREHYYQQKLDRSEAQQRLWAQNIRELEMEHQKVQRDYEELQTKHNESAGGETGAEESEDDDEFFDVEEPPAEEIEEEGKPKFTEKQQEIAKRIDEEDSFAGYEDGPRDKLTIDDDNRPRISLWGVLKNLIGKDMTRMTLPVSFNECTNLLQRSAEDMEYVDLLDKAAKAEDEGVKMAYVAAFCASSYSSTINRIAKPFNPLLGETFEYCRPDKGFRLMSEQVSHHPPIGAMLAEHPRWDFFGNSNVKSKFNGRSFEIKPTGQWFVKLRPDQGGEELISYRKIISSVVGIITGRPVVDNHGDMIIENHTTNYKVKVEYPSMGWRNTNAYEVKGSVFDPDGNAVVSLTGHWNDKIYYIKDHQKVCIWQAHERPPAPFNLTPFAITLNALPERLRKYVAPTDTRLRPDQRAMEEGRYDDASQDKHRVEEKQRAVRKKREASGEEYKPLWFDETTHPVTGELYYKPHGDYWEKRRDGELQEMSMDIF